MRRVALLLALLLAMGTKPALADPVLISVTLSFFPASIPGNPVFPEDSTLGGALSFYSEIPAGNGPQLLSGPPIDIGNVGKGASFVTSFIPTDPCFGNGSCQLDFSFAGTAATFPATAFAPGTALPNEQHGPPIVPVGTFLQQGPPIRLSGPIVAFDAPVVVGTYDITMSTVPEPATLPLALGGIGLLLWTRRRFGDRAAV
jgi:hypothetical protein